MLIYEVVLELAGVSGTVDSLPGTYIDQLFHNEKYHTPFTTHSFPDIDLDHIGPNGLVNKTHFGHRDTGFHHVSPFSDM